MQPTNAPTATVVSVIVAAQTLSGVSFDTANGTSFKAAFAASLAQAAGLPPGGIHVDKVVALSRRRRELGEGDERDGTARALVGNAVSIVYTITAVNVAGGSSGLKDGLATAVRSGALTAAMASNPATAAAASSATTPAAVVYDLSPSHVPTYAPTNNVYAPIPSFIAAGSSAAATVAVTATHQRQHNASLVVSFAGATAVNRVSGRVYCMAVKRGAAVPTVGTVVTSTAAGDFATRSTAVSVPITLAPLAALTAWQVYCAIRLTDGRMSNAADVAASVTAVTTACCKEVAFTAAPTSILASASSSPGGVFAYALEAPPADAALTVTPRFRWANGTAARAQLLTASPASATFAPSAAGAQLEARFYVYAPPTLTATIEVELVLSASLPSVVAQFTSDSATVAFVGAGRAAPAPQLLSCVFSNNGGSFTAEFDAPTDEAGTANPSASWPCNQLFKFVGAAYAQCVWIDSATVKGTFGNFVPSLAYLVPAGNFTLRGGLLRAECTGGAKACRANLAANASTVVVAPPAVPLVPSVVLGAPAQLGACSNLTLDLSASTGNGGRPWTAVTWGVTAVRADVTALKQYIVRNFVIAQARINVPRSLLPAADTYSITVALTNFLGGAASQAVAVTASGDRNQPSARIRGPAYLTMVASDALQLVGLGTPSACAAPGSTLAYAWTVLNSTGAALPLRSTSVDPTRLVLPPYSLTVGSTYTVSLKVQALAGKTVLSTANDVTTVYVASGAITAAVKGSSGDASRQVSVGAALVLDASASTDANAPPAKTRLIYRWSCTVASQQNFSLPCVFPVYSPKVNFTQSVFRLPPGALVTNGLYVFTVAVSSRDGRADSKSVLVQALQVRRPVGVLFRLLPS